MGAGPPRRCIRPGRPLIDPLPAAADWRRVLWPGIAALVAVMGVGRFVYTPILPEMLATGALTLREAGWVAAANFLGYLLGALAASAVHRRRLQGALARAGLGLTVAMLVAMALLDGTAAWSAARFLAGVGSAFSLVFVSIRVLERLSAIGEADRMVGLYAGVGVGIAGSALLMLAAEHAGAPWPAWWATAAVFTAPFAWVAWRGLADRGPAAAPAPRPARDAALPAARDAAGAAAAQPPPVSVQGPARGRAAAAPGAPLAFAAAVLAYGLFGLGYVIHATYLPAMVRAAGYPPAAATAIWVLVGLVALPSAALWRAVARRHGMRAAIALGYTVEGLTALVPLAGGSIGGAVVAAIGLGGTFMAVTGLALPFARALDPARAARAIGVMTAAFGAGQIVGPIAAAHLAEAAPLGGNPFAMPSLLAFAALLAAAALMAPRLDSAR